MQAAHAAVRLALVAPAPPSEAEAAAGVAVQRPQALPRGAAGKAEDVVCEVPHHA
ncbi:hypothetical protein [Roseomonas sp. CECT 9278]|uniref:hypothetical protein n=1 Tax=Roseomonas sp. CECT 9278 TaxID=2845823 RepID=UPI001E638D22|nr:hypothetical protein [Roseomonas sp. CECT 9278]